MSKIETSEMSKIKIAEISKIETSEKSKIEISEMSKSRNFSNFRQCIEILKYLFVVDSMRELWNKLGIKDNVPESMKSDSKTQI